MRLSRRHFLAGSAAALAAGLLPRSQRHARATEGYGPLLPDPDGILDLPAGFSYRVLERRGEPMSDGYRVPGRPDGMACFAGPVAGTLVLLRNHENSPGDVFNGPYHLGQAAPPESYQANGMGGVTRLVVDATSFERVSSNLVLVGTTRNCGGGPSPWGWLSAEENVDGGHGWVFVCPVDAATVRAPHKLPGYGRFEHEAVAIDPATLAAYLTEDKGDSCLYRFLPADPAAPFVGKLQAMRVLGHPAFDTASGLQVGDTFQIDWVDLADPTPIGDTLRMEARQKGAALVKRGEGIWWEDDHCYFVSTTGGPASAGQVFKLTPSTGLLQLVVQSPSKDVLDMPDNITVAAWGELFLAEDGNGANYIRTADAHGNVGDFAKNALSNSEFCGVCFSPDARALFVNIQGDGLTLVITGPFPTVTPPPPPPPDAGPPDAGPADAGPADAGPPDAGAPDAEPATPGAIDAGKGPTTNLPDAGGTGVEPPPGEEAAGCGCEVGAAPSGTPATLLIAGALLGAALVGRDDTR